VKTPRLREWREAMGETQATLGERSGVAEHTISRIEHGASLRPTTARKLADALGVAVADLMERPPIPLDEAPQEEGRPRYKRTLRDSILVDDNVKRNLEPQFNALINALKASGLSEKATELERMRDEVLAA
jgi:transcriptional regulator with XRE-family HTH domain